MKYIAIFDIPDGYAMGCAVGKICVNDGKVKSDADFKNVYAQIEPLSGDREEMFLKYTCVDRIFNDLGLENAYDMPGFWCRDKKGNEDYKVIPTQYHKGYMQALGDVEKEIRKRFGFAEEIDVQLAPPFMD